MRIFIIFAVLSIILETVFWPYPFTLLMSMTAFLSLGAGSMPLVFLSGLILDLSSLRTIGIDSLIFILTGQLILLYKRKFMIGSLWFVIFFFMAAISIYSFYFYRPSFGFLHIVVSFILIAGILKLSTIYIPSFPGEKKELTI